MSGSEIGYYNSDAWVLLAIIYANRWGDATLDRIIAAGDAINVAIFLPSELEGGLVRLTAGGYVVENNGIFVPTDKVLGSRGLSSTRGAMLRELDDVEKMLGGRSTTPVNDVKYPGFTIPSYEEAVEKYLYSVRSGA